MKQTRRKPESASRILSVTRRLLERRDRELFSPGSEARASSSKRFYHLWDRILFELAEALAGHRSMADLARLEGLADELARAQARRHLPMSLIRRIVQDSHGPAHEKQA